MNFNNLFAKNMKKLYSIYIFFFTSNNFLSIIPITPIGNFPICFISIYVSTRFFRKLRGKEKFFSLYIFRHVKSSLIRLPPIFNLTLNLTLYFLYTRETKDL